MADINKPEIVKPYLIKIASVLLAFLIMSLSCKVKTVNHDVNNISTKHDYDIYILHGDQYVHSIVNHYFARKSKFLASGSVRSIKTYDIGSDLNQGFSIQFFYNSRKEIERIINFDQQSDTINDRTFYRYGPSGGEYIIKHAKFQSENREITSSIDTLKKIVVNREYRNGELKQIDSCYYEKDFYPILIKKFRSNMIFKHLVKMEYENDKTTLKFIAGKSGKINRGEKRFYNEKGRLKYISDLDYVDIDNLTYKIGDQKRSVMSWSGNDFKYQNTDKIKSQFISKDRIYKYNQDSIIFSIDLLPMISYRKNKGLMKEHIKYSYNENRDIIKQDFIESDTYDEIFSYKYDEKNNWTERKLYINGEYESTTIREITYW